MYNAHKCFSEAYKINKLAVKRKILGYATLTSNTWEWGNSVKYIFCALIDPVSILHTFRQ